MFFKKIKLLINLKFLKIMHRLNYKYYLKHYPLYLKKMGVNFTGDISNTGFIASNVKFDSVAYADKISVGENTIVGVGSVVKGNIPSGVIVAGNPATIIKTTEEYARYHMEKMDFLGEIPEE